MKSTSSPLPFTSQSRHLCLAAAATLALAPFASAVQPAGQDNFANAPAITACNDVSSLANLTSYTSETGEPGHLGGGSPGAQKSAWWKWTAPESGFCTVDTLASANLVSPVADTLLAIYTGTSVDALTRVIANDTNRFGVNTPGSNFSAATFYATKGVTYYIAADAYTAGNINASQHDVNIRVRHLPARKRTRLAAWGIPSSDPAWQGSLSLNQTTTHAFTGKLVVGGKSHPLKGVFGADGYCGIAIERKAPAGAAPLAPMTLWIDGSLEGRFTLYLGGDLAATGRLYDAAVFTPQNLNKGAGAYTLGLSCNKLPSVGGLAVTVKPTGAVTAAGFLPDGTTATLSSQLCDLATDLCAIPVYQSLSAGKGYIRDTWQLAEQGTVDTITSMTSGLFWRAPNAKSAFYSEGILEGVNVYGRTYTKPAAQKRAEAFLDTSMGAGFFVMPALTGETTMDVSLGLTFSTANKFTFTPAPANKPSLTLNPATGMLTGSVTVPPGKPRALRGLLYTSPGMAYITGCAAGVTQNLRFDVTP